MSLSTRTIFKDFLLISWNMMSIMVLLIFFIHIGLVLLIGLPKILINHFITTNTTTTSDLMTKITLTCSALPAPPSASVACQQDHLHHRHCPSCRLLSPPSPNQHLPTPKKLTQPLPEELIATKLQILPQYHFTSPTKARIFANVKSGAFSSDVVSLVEVRLLSSGDQWWWLSLCRRPFEAKQRC